MCCCMMMHTMDCSERMGPMTSVRRQEDSLLDILRHRYASGEISREQYDEMKRVLDIGQESGPHPAGSHVGHEGGGGRACAEAPGRSGSVSRLSPSSS